MPADRNIDVSKLTPGSVLAKTVSNAAMTKLLRSGYTVNEHLIKRLAELGVTDVDVVERAKPFNKQPRASILNALSVGQNGHSNGGLAVARDCVCGTTIAIQPPIPDCPVATWICQTCGVIYFGVGGDIDRLNYLGVEPLYSDGIIQVEVDGDQSEPDVPTDNQESVRTTDADIHSGPNLRRQKRYSVLLPVVAIPLALDFRVAGEAVSMKITNMSRGGCALAYTRFTDFPYYVLDFTAAGIELLQVVLKVVRVVNSGPVYEVAGGFISRIRQTRHLRT